MSVVINYVSNTVSVIVTDTRVTKIDGTNEDGNQKLKNIESDGMGWVTGAGSGDFLDLFNNKLSERDLTQASQIEDIYNESLKISNHIEDNKSMASISWVDINEDGISNKLAVVSNDDMIDGLSQLHNDNFFIFYPSDFKEKQVEEIESKYTMDYHFGGNLKQLLGTILSIFHDISMNSDAASSECEIGLQFIDQQGIHKAHAKYDVSKFEEEKRSGKVSLNVKVTETIPFQTPQ